MCYMDTLCLTQHVFLICIETESEFLVPSGIAVVGYTFGPTAAFRTVFDL